MSCLANAFSYMRIIEEWGSGIPRMFDEFSRYGLAEPELVDMDGDFRVNFYRSSVKQVQRVKHITFYNVVCFFSFLLFIIHSKAYYFLKAPLQFFYNILALFYH